MEAMEFGDRLRAIRKRLNLKQTELADALDVAVDTVRRWEAGTHEPKLSDVKSLATALGMTVAEMIGEEPLPKEGPRPTVQSPPKKKEPEKIIFQHGLSRWEIPATREGYAIVREKLGDFSMESIPPEGAVKVVQVE